MDGFKRRLNESIQLKLSFSLSLVILIVAVVAGIFSFASAFDEAHELQDDTLRQVAALFDSQHRPRTHPGEVGRARDSDEESRVIVQYLTERGKVAGTDGVGVSVPLPLSGTMRDGLQTLGGANESFRVLVKTTDVGDRIAVAQATGTRDEIARNSALRTLMPFLILVPLLLLVVAQMVRNMFQPIAALSTEIDHRAEHELHPVEQGHVPVEVRPFVVAINRLLARVTRSMEVQRRFVADAAHELRSPLTAMSLQAERLSKAEMSDPARQRLETLQRGIERGRNLLDQLLTLAKVQIPPDQPKSPTSVHGIYRRVLEDLMPMAEVKRIDIGVEGEHDAWVWVSELDMNALVKNLVDNAIRYTPDGGRVDLSVVTLEGSAVLNIQDNGPGISLIERERVFDAFYRTLGSDQIGSGLGMSIVKAICVRIGAEIALEFADGTNSSGLSVHVRIPLANNRHRSAYETS